MIIFYLCNTPTKNSAETSFVPADNLTNSSSSRRAKPSSATQNDTPGQIVSENQSSIDAVTIAIFPVTTTVMKLNFVLE